MTPGPLQGRTVLMSGGSRGIGLAIATRLARDGVNVAFLAKTDTPDPRLPGTVHTAAAQIAAAGAGRVLPLIGDVRHDDAVSRAADRTVEVFGGIDIVVNNASAIALQGLGTLSSKRYDLMMDVNARGTFGLITAALPHLLQSPDPRVLTLSPPLNLDPVWLADFSPYTVSKYAMTLLTLGLAEQYKATPIIANCLWPATLIATSAVRNVVAGESGIRASRRPEIMADAAALLLSTPAEHAGSGLCHIDADVLRAAGVDDLSIYAHAGATDDQLTPDLFL